MRLLIFLFVILSGRVLAIGGKSGILLQPSFYEVKSDTFDEKIPQGQCIVSGKVVPIIRGDYNGDGKLDSIPRFLVSSTDHEKQTYTDQYGNYVLKLGANDTAVYVFAPGYEEVVAVYSFKSQHHVIINFSVASNYSMMTVDKPVIYLYSQEELNVSVDFESKSNVVFTYPEYSNGWNFMLKENQLTDAQTGRAYPYLFWEGKTDNLDFHVQNGCISGSIVKTDTVVSFLENALAAMGMNATEQTDFITFWTPRIINHDYVLIQFLDNKLYDEKISTLSVVPTPDNVLRTFMLFSPVEEHQLPLQIIPQEFEPVDRSGFTVVEWGGAMIEQPFVKWN